VAHEVTHATWADSYLFVWIYTIEILSNLGIPLPTLYTCRMVLTFLKPPIEETFIVCLS